MKLSNKTPGFAETRFQYRRMAPLAPDQMRSSGVTEVRFYEPYKVRDVDRAMGDHPGVGTP